jgi:hypothetical protein
VLLSVAIESEIGIIYLLFKALGKRNLAETRLVRPQEIKQGPAIAGP